MSSLNSNPSNKDLQSVGLQEQSSVKRRKQRNKNGKEYHSLNHSIAGKSDGQLNSEEAKEDEQAKLQEMVKNVRKIDPHSKHLSQNRNSINLEVLPEEGQSRNGEGRGDKENKSNLNTIEHTINEKSNERKLPIIVGVEHLNIELMRNQGNKSRSPALFKSKLTASLNQKQGHNQ